MKLQKIRIKNFRGYGEANNDDGFYEFNNLDNSLVVLNGFNGFGKTSFYEAIAGPRGVLHGSSERELVESAAQRGVHLTFMSHKGLIKFYLAHILPTSTEDFMSKMMETAHEARMKDETFEYIRYVARKHGLIE